MFNYVNNLAQDNNYWGMQFGAKSSLLGGSSLAWYADNGSMYYNPATLAFADSNVISISATMYRAEKFVFNKALGDSINSIDYNFDITPQAIDYTFKVNKKLHMGFILLTKQNLDILLAGSEVGRYHILGDYPNPSFDYIADYSLRSRIVEQWLGYCASYKLNTKFTVGVGTYLQYRFQRIKQDLAATAVSVDTINYSAQYDNNKDVKYDVLTCAFKLGACYTPNKTVSFGLCVTLPSFMILGRGQSYNRYNFNNLQINSLESYLIFDRQLSLKAKYKNPLSIALGSRINLKKTSISLGFEYFAAIKDYDIIDPSNAVNIKKKGVQYNSDILLGVSQYASDVLNFALGAETKINDRFILLMGFRSDFNTQKNDILNEDYYKRMALTSMDIWHFSIGAHFANNYVIGVNFSYGQKNNVMQWANFNNPYDWASLVYNTSSTANYKYSALGIILGFSF